jgi:integrase
MGRNPYNNIECITQMKRLRNKHHGYRRSFAEIAQVLNEQQKFKSPTGIYGGWHTQTVQSILKRVGRLTRRKRIRKLGVFGNDTLTVRQSVKLFECCLDILGLDFTTKFTARRKLPYRRVNRAAKLILALMLTGIRRAELCGLRVQDLPASHGKPEIIVRGKGGTVGAVQITPFTEAFFNWVHGQRRTGFVFYNEAGRAYHPDQINPIVAKIGRNAGLDFLKPHALRRTYASIMLWDGCNITYVRDQLRHLSIATTDIYANVIREEHTDSMPKIVNKFLRALNPQHPDNAIRL